MDESADQMLSELTEVPPTMGRLKRVRYSHDAMIDLIVGNPGISQREIALVMGYTEGWISNVFASDAFKSRLAARRSELIDPVLTQSIEERFEGLARQGLERLQEKLDKPNVSDAVVLKAVELGARAVGVGGYGAAKIVPPPPAPDVERLNRLANRLLALSGRPPETIEGELVPAYVSAGNQE